MFRLVLAFVITICAVPALAQTRHALVVGVDMYSELPQLNRAGADARAIEATLSQIGVQTTLVLNPDRQTLLKRLDAFSTSLGRGDEAIFFFAGHGIEMDGQNYLLPTDVPAQAGALTVREQSLSLQTVISAIQGSGVRVSVFIIDACRDNPFPKGTRSIGGTRGLAPAQETEGTFVMFSAGAGQTALDRLPGEDASPNSVFTRALLPRLSTPGLDLRQTALEVREDVRQMAAKAGHSQFPALYDQMVGSFTLVPAAAMSAPPEPAPAVGDPCTAARTDWSLVSQSNSAAAYRAFFELHKDCPLMAALAQERLEGLAKTPVAASSSAAAAPTALDRRALVAFESCKSQQLDASLEDLRAGGDLAALIADCREALGLTEKRSEGEYWLGRSLEANAQIEDARSWYRLSAGKGFGLAKASLQRLDALAPIIASQPAPATPSDSAAATAFVRCVEGADKDFATLEAMSKPQLDRVIVDCRQALNDSLNRVEAQFKLALSLDAAGQDLEAAKWYLAAAQQGHAQAMNNLGLMLKNGEGVPEDDVEAVKWFRAAADKGVAGAMNSLGRSYDEGEGVAEDDAQAVVWYRAAAEKGNLSGMRNLGLMLKNGEGVAEDDVEAVKWFRAAAEKGSVEAMNSLGRSYDEGEGVTIDDAEAVRWYRAAAEKGNASAMNNLGLMLKNGEGVTEDDVEAVRWFRLAAENGNVEAMNSLGRSLDEGEGVAIDDVEAVRWYRAAAEQGSASAMNNLGWMLRYGEGVTEDDVEAAKWFRAAADLGNATAMNSLGLMYATGEGVPRNPSVASEEIIKGIKNGTRWFIDNHEGRVERDVRIEIQKRLAEEGIYGGPIDGSLGPGTEAAMEALLARAN
ncbi:MAG: caspase family protein [Rhodobacteraceae bacterium]|nr:caspase family protein [Paracoccaceae bacterium]MCF8513037.1 caspase family protein [Paracoccaceae bacterium]MCF8517282.1 caspase family protein [Paracoccaceae bacterium]